MGCALLAWLPWDEAKNRLQLNPRKKRTNKTITVIDQIEKILTQVRKDGFAINDGELAPELY